MRGPQLASETRRPGVLEWAREHLSEPLSVDVLADVAHMSRRTFTRRFREATGTTVIQWLNAQRVARAQQLLETTDRSEEHTSELQSLMRISYAVFCLQKKKTQIREQRHTKKIKNILTQQSI